MSSEQITKPQTTNYKLLFMFTKFFKISLSFSVLAASLVACKPKGAGSAISGDAASKVYIAPGKYDEFYDIVSGGFNGQMSVYGIPSGRLLRIIPVFSTQAESGWR